MDGWTGIGTLRGPRGPKKVEFGILLLGMYALATWVFQDVLSFGQVMFSMVAISQSYKTTLLMTNIYG